MSLPLATAKPFPLPRRRSPSRLPRLPFHLGAPPPLLLPFPRPSLGIPTRALTCSRPSRAPLPSSSLPAGLRSPPLRLHWTTLPRPDGACLPLLQPVFVTFNASSPPLTLPPCLRIRMPAVSP